MIDYNVLMKRLSEGHITSKEFLDYAWNDPNLEPDDIWELQELVYEHEAQRGRLPEWSGEEELRVPKEIKG
tara:strand:+ start:435 stop:647 length:213 start_codon:yes stop_codon:yes gene_type:complete